MSGDSPGTRVNFLEETIAALEANGKSPRGVRWVGSSDGKMSISWDEFSTISKSIYYYPCHDRHVSSYEIAHDLVIVGFGWWLERVLVNNIEKWAYREIPRQKSDIASFTRVMSDLTDLRADSYTPPTVKLLNAHRSWGDGLENNKP